MIINERHAIVICPASVIDQASVPVHYKFIDSETCPLGNDNCSFNNANITHCVRGGRDGVHTICLCKPLARLQESDIAYFAGTIRQIGGEDMLKQILNQLRRNGKNR